MEQSKIAKILYRHPDAEVRALPPKVLEWKDANKEEHFFVPEEVNGKIIYTVPIPFARRMLANQPERYFLLEPAILSVKRQNATNFTSTHITVKSVLGTKMMGTLGKDQLASAPAQQTLEAPLTPSLDRFAPRAPRPVAHPVPPVQGQEAATAPVQDQGNDDGLSQEDAQALENVSLEAPAVEGKPPEDL